MIVMVLGLWGAWANVGWAQEPSREPSPRLTEAQIERALFRYRREPSVQRLIDAAVRTRVADPSRVSDAMDRARGTGWLPTTRASLRRGQAIDLRALGGVEGAPANVSTGDDLSFEATMTFRFDRIVFAAEEVGLLRELRAMEQQQAELVRIVVSLYYERRRLQLERDLAGRSDLLGAMRILEAEALLDSFTGGAFTRMMGARSESER
jgi:hypothetical protein